MPERERPAMLSQDIHTLSNLKPADYEVVMYHTHYLGYPLLTEQAQEIRREQVAKYVAVVRNPLHRRHENGGCKVCGQTTYHDCVIYRHWGTGETIELGWMCAEKLDMAIDYDTMRSIKQQRTREQNVWAARKERKANFKTFVTDHRTDGLLTLLKQDHHIVKSMRGYIGTSGKLSEKQIELVNDLARKHAEREAERAALKNVPVTEERILIEGVVIFTKWQETQYGEQRKMIILTDGEYKLWGTVPSKILQEVEKGSRVSFMAKVKVSDDDPTFGYYSRPTKPTVENGIENEA